MESVIEAAALAAAIIPVARLVTTRGFRARLGALSRIGLLLALFITAYLFVLILLALFAPLVLRIVFVLALLPFSYLLTLRRANPK